MKTKQKGMKMVLIYIIRLKYIKTESEVDMYVPNHRIRLYSYIIEYLITFYLER